MLCICTSAPLPLYSSVLGKLLAGGEVGGPGEAVLKVHRGARRLSHPAQLPAGAQLAAAAAAAAAGPAAPARQRS